MIGSAKQRKQYNDRDAAVADLKRTKRETQELESIGACRHAIKTFTLEALGDGKDSAGGPKARKNRFEVLDRLKTVGAGLSPGQMYDWAWFKESWDDKMVDQYATTWGSVFAKWM